MIGGLRLVPKIKITEAARKSSRLPICPKTTISCSIVKIWFSLHHMHAYDLYIPLYHIYAHFYSNKYLIHLACIRSTREKVCTSQCWTNLPCTYACMQAQPKTVQTVQDIIVKQLSIDESTVTPQTKFADLGADSLDTVCMSCSVSNSFSHCNCDPNYSITQLLISVYV